MQRIMVDMSATLLHHGHIRLLRKASEHGHVVVGLTSDEEIVARKGYMPELDFQQRAEIMMALSDVAEVVETPWLITEAVLDEHRIDLLVHGDDNSNQIPPERLLVFPRTQDISSTELRKRATAAQVAVANQRLMLTPGPAALLYENIVELQPVFGRGDDNFAELSAKVHEWLLRLSGQDEIVSMQGSATMALELGVKSFVDGRCLLVDTGYYADRMGGFVPPGVATDRTSYDDLARVAGEYDWVIACYTETSCAFKADITYLRQHADRLGARLFLDATASIGLEPDHGLADAMGFSSCKGLFGFTGAAFVAHKKELELPAQQDSYYFNLATQRNHGVTGPYHAICSLAGVMPEHEKLLNRVRASKEACMAMWSEFIPASTHQPLLCTYVEAEIVPLDDNVVLYSPRSTLSGSVLCHFGEIWKDDINLDRRIRLVAHDGKE